MQFLLFKSKQSYNNNFSLPTFCVWAGVCPYVQVSPDLTPHKVTRVSCRFRTVGNKRNKENGVVNGSCNWASALAKQRERSSPTGENVKRSFKDAELAVGRFDFLVLSFSQFLTESVNKSAITLKLLLMRRSGGAFHSYPFIPGHMCNRSCWLFYCTDSF